MLIDFDRTIAYRCANCGEIVYGSFSLFEISGDKGISVSCSCGETAVKIAHEKRTGYTVSTECIACGEIHSFAMPFETLVRREYIEFFCPDISLGIACIGKERAVRRAVGRNEKSVAEILSACGLEHTGKNGMIMLRAIEKLQDLSENDNLHCSCGSKIIDIEIREREIVLDCCVCGTKMSLDIDYIKHSGLSHLNEIIIKPS